MPTIQDLENDLRSEITALEARFLANWIPAQPTHRPENFQHDVKAYCVLAHAVFEEFVEEVSLVALKAAKGAWLSKKFSAGTVALLLSYGGDFSIAENEDVDQEKVFDQIRKCLDDCATKHSNALANNHGFSLKYLRNILTPIGIDIPSDIKLMESLRELAAARGSYAHSQSRLARYGQWKRADRPMVPEKANQAVNDCLDLCLQLAQRVAELQDGR